MLLGKGLLWWGMGFGDENQSRPSPAGPAECDPCSTLTHGVVVTAGAGGWVPPRGSASPPFLSALSMGKWLGHPAHNVSPTHKIQQYPHPPLLH